MGIIGILDAVDMHFVPRHPAFKIVWDRFYVLPAFSWQTWVSVTAVVFLVFGLYGAYRFALDLSRRFEDLIKHKIIFELDEVSTRAFVSEDPPLITAKLKTRFENKDIHDGAIKTLRLTLHCLSTNEEVMTWIMDDRYFHVNNVEIKREAFEGMTIQGRRLSPWYICIISIDAMSGFTIPDDLTDDHYLSVSMAATNQELFKTRIFVNWERARTKNGTAVVSIGAPAIRQHEDRLLLQSK